MRKRTFKIMPIGDGGVFKEVDSYDYDETINLVRYKEVLYDIPTGLWVVTLNHIQKDIKAWKGCGAFPSANVSNLLKIVKSNGIFRHRLEKRRAEVDYEIMNPEEPTLFDL
jgi:hypothetical protein